MCNIILLSEKVSALLTNITINAIVDYLHKLASFTQNLKEFYMIRGKRFQAKDLANLGGNETFYMHCLRFYLPKISQ